jgi:hypothetical protein
MMRSVTVLLAALALAGAATGAMAAKKMRLAQTSAVTSCMMSCNSQAAACQSTCLVPGTPPVGAALATGNANTSTVCVLGCSSQQLQCHTNCARTSPSQ